MTELQFVSPSRLDELQALIDSSCSGIAYIAGGTDLLVTGADMAGKRLLVDLSRLPELALVESRADGIVVGAATTVAELCVNPLVRARVPLLARAAEQCGSLQIRNRATIGGNVANASPAGDLLTALACLDARLHLMGRGARSRVVSVDEFVRGPRQTVLEAGELIARIEVPASRSDALYAFAKLGRRREMTVSMLNLAAVARPLAAGNGIVDLRLFAGAIGPRPRRLIEAEAVFEGCEQTPEILRAFLDALVCAVERAIPGRASMAYKRKAVVGLGQDLLSALMQPPLFNAADRTGGAAE